MQKVLGTTVKDLMRKVTHTCSLELGLPKAASQLHDRSTQRLFAVSYTHLTLPTKA